MRGDAKPASGLMREAVAPLRLLTWLTSSSPKKIVESILPAATAPEFEKTTGKFLYRGKEIDAPAYAHDQEAQQRLWDISESLTDLASTQGKLPVTDPQF